jgi:hypothetical protein
MLRVGGIVADLDLHMLDTMLGFHTSFGLHTRLRLHSSFGLHRRLRLHTRFGLYLPFQGWRSISFPHPHGRGRASQDI